MPDRMPDRMSDRMSDRMPAGMPHKVPEGMPDKVPDRMPEDLPDRMPDRMSEDMPEDMPDRMPDRMPEDMSDRMPEDLPVTKRINVMVGMTRTKVYNFEMFLFFLKMGTSPKSSEQSYLHWQALRVRMGWQVPEGEHNDIRLRGTERGSTTRKQKGKQQRKMKSEKIN